MKKKFKKGGSGIKPDLYWKYILLVTLLLFLASCVFGLLLFMKINKGPVLPNIDNSRQDMVKKERIDKALQYFGEREKKSAEILNSPSPIIDPSL